MSLHLRRRGRRPVSASSPAARLGLEKLEQRCLLAGITDPSLVLSAPLQPRPSVGVPFVEPVFGTSITRVSDANDRGGFETQIYSQLQAFSADNQYLLTTGSDGYVIRQLDDFASISELDTSTWNAPRWHPTVSQTVVHYDSNDDTTLRVQFTDIATSTTTNHFTFPGEFERIRVSQSFDEISRDGRWLAGMATRSDGASVIFSLDLESRELGAVLPIPDLYSSSCLPDPVYGEVEPDWIGVSPLGNYLVVQWTRDGQARCSGLETFNIDDGSFTGRVTDHHAHGDLGLAADGVTEIFMTSALSSPENGNFPALVTHELPGTETVSPADFLRTVDWGIGSHFSLQGPAGVGLVSASRLGPANDAPFEKELFLQYLDGSVLRLAHHRSSECGYWVQPRASISRDGRYVVFSSDWREQSAQNSCDGQFPLGAGEPYLIDLMEQTPSNLVVSDFGITATGFTATFNQDLDTGLLNLFDTASAGPADVEVQGDVGGPIGGSLVVDPLLRRITFVATEGALAADEYTVSLRGGDLGFRSVAGGSLDGDANGTAGDDYSFSFTVQSDDARLLSVPSFVRGPGQAIEFASSGNPGVPVGINNADGVTSAEFELHFDSETLAISAATVADGLPMGTTVTLESVEAGQATLRLISPLPLDPGPTELFVLAASVPVDAPYARQALLAVRNVDVRGAGGVPISARGAEAIQRIAVPGDLSENGRVNASDASLVARIAAALDEGFSAAPLTDPRVIGDFNRNGRVDPADASFVARVAAQLIVGGGVLSIPTSRPVRAQPPIETPGLTLAPSAGPCGEERCVVSPGVAATGHVRDSSDLAIESGTDSHDLLFAELANFLDDLVLF